MARIIITGAAGFIGSWLADKLYDEGHTVLGIDDLSGGDLSNGYRPIKFIEADCRDVGLMDKIFRKFKPEIVYHLAANAAENKAQFSPIDITSRNYDAFIKVLTPFIKYGGKRFIFTSSIAVYGSLQTPFKETDKPEPEDLYGVTKLAAEQTLKIMSKIHDFEYVIARPHNVFGPRQNMKDPYRNVVTIWINSILRNKPCYIYGDGKQTRCFSYVEDVVNALVNCMDSNIKNKTFNIGSDNRYTLNQLAKILSSETKFEYLPKRLQEVKEAISDHTLAKKYLKYRDSVTLEEGLELTWNWCKSQGPQEPVYTEIEIPSEKIPENWKK